MVNVIKKENEVLLKKTIKMDRMILLGVGAVSTTLWLTIPRWLPVVAKSYLPEGVSLSLTQPRLQQWGCFIDDIALKVIAVPWLMCSNLRLTIKNSKLIAYHLIVNNFTILTKGVFTIIFCR